MCRLVERCWYGGAWYGVVATLGMALATLMVDTPKHTVKNSAKHQINSSKTIFYYDEHELRHKVGVEAIGEVYVK
jgi:hypothetical protein